jgi:agmatinase
MRETSSAIPNDIQMTLETMMRDFFINGPARAHSRAGRRNTAPARPPSPSGFRQAQHARLARGREGREASLRRLAAGTAWALRMGLTGSDSLEDKTIPTFARGELPHYAGINTFLKAPYIEDVDAGRQLRCGGHRRPV